MSASAPELVAEPDAGPPDAPRFPPAGPGGRLGFATDRWLISIGASLEREMVAARGLPWLAVAFAGGALLYISLPAEPSAPALVLLAVALGIGAWRARAGRAALFRLLLVTTMIAGGVALTKLRTDLVATPMIARSVTATVTGFVEAVDARRGGARLTLRVVSIDGARIAPLPQRVTVVLRGKPPGVGEGISVLARLRPPSGPAMPGGYDFARKAYYAGIGATGFAYGKPKTVDLGAPPLTIRLAMPLESLREAIRARILAALPGDTGRVATALVIGDAGGISAKAEDDLRQSGLAHVLSVSGLHMVLVAGASFWAIRALLALFPGVALRHPIKKWAAVGALALTFFYLLISGLDVAAQRSFAMTAVVFGAILIDRRAISMRNVALATFAVLLLAPESVLDAGFQMSFAATIALVAGFELLARRRRRARVVGETSLAGTLLRWTLALVGGLALTSLLGGLGTTPFALYHFQRMAPLSIVANVLAMPLIDFLVMPMALVGVLVMPFGLDQPMLALMGVGIDGMLWVADLVSRWSEGTGGMAMPPAASLLIFLAGFLWAALWGERWRWLGAVPMLAGIVLAFFPMRPDLVVAADGRSAAIRTADGRYAILAPKVPSFEAGIWLRADGDARGVKDKSLTEGVRCDALGCITRLADGRLVALSLDRGALAEDCRSAALVVTPLQAPPACRAVTAVIDRTILRRDGALALILKEKGAPSAAPPEPIVNEAQPEPRAYAWSEADGDPAAMAPFDEGGEVATAEPPLAPEAKTPSGPVTADPSRLDALATVVASYPPLRRAFMPPGPGD
jgi:competence protein ComEC